MNDYVVARVGGGWCKLDEFLYQHGLIEEKQNLERGNASALHSSLHSCIRKLQNSRTHQTKKKSLKYCCFSRFSIRDKIYAGNCYFKCYESAIL